MEHSKSKILFVDDSEKFQRLIFLALRDTFDLTVCSLATEALALLKSGKQFNAIVSDMRMPGMNGVEFLSQAAVLSKDAVRIMLTGHADMDTAIAAVNCGKISHFLQKPCSMKMLREILESSIMAASLSTSPALDKSERVPSLDKFLGESEKIVKLKSVIQKLSSLDSTVLITGESGTGKSLAAEIMHSISCRRDKPFVRVSCPSLSEGVFEAELFGSIKGAYTGSISDSPGRFSMADRGSIFLDEIGDVPLSKQAKLLQVIERKEFERVGDHKTQNVDARIIAATNAKLNELVKQGLFRNDLYHRLNVMRFSIPPLRERQSDIPLLASHFLSGLPPHLESSDYYISDNALEVLVDHSWPGNVRELKHCIEYSAMFCEKGIIRKKNLPETLTEAMETSSSEALSSVAGTVTDRLLAALKMSGWNKTKAARKLGMSRSTLYRKMKQKGISEKEPSQ